MKSMFCTLPLWMRHLGLILLLSLVLAGHVLAASPQIEPTTSEAGHSLLDSSFALKYELTGLVAGIGAIGLSSWNWGNSSFHTNSEGWFGLDTGSGGADKLGHMYSAYLLSEFLRARLIHQQEAVLEKRAARDAAIFSMALMTFVEVFDGVSGDHGFSGEDMVMNSLGVGFSYLRGLNPQLSKTLDLRWQYWPSERASGFHPMTDYEGHKYNLALKPAGFKLFRETPLKYLELHLGYFTRGFKRAEGYTDKDRRSTLYLGLGLNLEELIFRPMRNDLGRAGIFANSLLKYFQIPGTSADIALMKRPGH